MSWTIYVNWPGADERLQGQHPGFVNDEHAWAEWIQAVNQDETALQIIRDLEIEALLVGSSGSTRNAWPDDVIEAAMNLRILIQSQDDAVTPLVEVYAPNSPKPDAPHEALMQDLLDIEAIARYAGDEGAREMTLEYARFEDSLM